MGNTDTIQNLLLRSSSDIAPFCHSIYLLFIFWPVLFYSQCCFSIYLSSGAPVLSALCMRAPSQYQKCYMISIFFFFFKLSLSFFLYLFFFLQRTYRIFKNLSLHGELRYRFFHSLLLPHKRR